ncbi:MULTISPECIES: complex I subunit 4 family protein [Methylomonas]|uniref:NADH-quinone oxidoreductase subunit M n=2 Tax=Methylomonas TaxID=416 RepID=A0A126T513_9GAMM|nr:MULTISPECIES: NADH-quinone oxidoreductase subunit M [Methylomonas]AMK77166.1 NADH:quinone oxidoreductase [Methylomonas denitrificans]OAH97098.1 NADH:quinone oxidoreductase [Methylomonas methanica]TCV82677.1 NADH dehydrogenase subunit M [Methylomonas methanica]
MNTPIVFWQAVAAVPLLTVLTLVPLLAMLAVVFAKPIYSVRLAFGGALLNVLLSIYLLLIFDSESPGIHLAEHFRLLGMNYRVGVDGTNILFIPLTAILGLLALVYTLITRHRNDRLFIACLLAYQGILIGAFAALNTLQFWFWCLLELVPVVLLTVFAGTGKQRNQVVKSVLQYWLSGLAMSLAGFILLSFGLAQNGLELSFDWLTLKHHNLAIPNETLIFILLFFGFAIRMPLFPFHAWLPLLAEHGTAASAAIFLTGLKLGIYALIRFILPLVPGAAEQWVHFVVDLGLIGIFYGALLALMQINMRRLLAFAVISHTGMLAIGVFSFNDFALEGSILLSIAYGLATAGMLFSIGLIYERTRTSFLPRLGGLFETNSTIALLFLISALSTMVMPGTPGFDAAHLLIEGTIEEHGWYIAIAILLGNVLGAAFLLWAFQRLFIAHPQRVVQPYGSIHHPVLKERIIAVTICGLLIGTGFYTTPWLKFIDQEAKEIGEHYPEHHSHHMNGPHHD